MRLGNNSPDMNVAGNGNTILDGNTSPSVTDDTEFGSVSAASGSVVHTFTITNSPGTANLTLNGSPIVAITGTHASDFSVTTMPATTITTTGSTTFQITFDPTGDGLRQAIVSISNNDPDENPYDFNIQGTGLAPEIAIMGNGKNIDTGDSTASVDDDTYFGSHDINTGSSSHIFTIQNTGGAALDLTATPRVAITGTNPADFTVTASPATPVGAGNSTTFTLLFDPGAAGLRTATISIANTDTGENPFTFYVQGTGTVIPEIAILGNLNNISCGDTSPSTTDLTDFGGHDIFAAQTVHTFTIQNLGSGNLSLTGLPRVQISGDNAGDFLVSQQPASTTVSPAGSLSFQIAFDPTTTGVRNAIIIVANNDADENPFTFAVKGLGTSTLDEEIEVLGNGLVIESGDNFTTTNDFTDMGTAEISGIPATASFVIRNIGYAVLSLTGPPPYVSFTGANASDFNISSTPSNSIAIDSATTSFEVTFTPSALGTRQAIVSIQNNDSDENPYTFTIQGTGVYDPNSLSEISLKGNMQVILAGDFSPSIADGTNFGSVEVIGGFTATQDFVISNTGSDDLVLGDNPIIAISGAQAGDFTVISYPANLVSPNSNVVFTVEFNPSATGLREATISINNSAMGIGNPFTFGIQGTGTTTPEMGVSGNSLTISNGDVSPSVSDSTMFGDVDITSGFQFVTYTISNSGNAALTLGTISFSGAHATDFSVESAPASPVSTGNSTSLVVKFDPSSVGSRTAMISVANNDPDRSPFTFSLQGNGTSPEDGVIGNRVWLDNDGDGLQDAGEDAMAGITVSLYDSGDNLLGSVVSGADGSYTFEGLASGNYYLTFTNPPSGYALSPVNQGGDDALDSDADPGNGGKTATFLLNISATDNTWDAGFKTTGVGNFVWLDVNENGIQDGGETGVPGIDVEIKIEGGASVATTTTDANGYYSFTNISPQTYRLYFSNLAAGYVFTSQDAGGDDLVDSDVNTTSGQSDAFALALGVFNSTIDVGVYQQSAPEISIKGNNVDIVDGDTSPSVTDDTDFGSLNAQIDTSIHSFKIFNGNGATLTLNGTPKIVVSGTNAADFTVVVQPSATVASNDSTSFEIRFIPSAEGLRAASISLSNTDSDENPFNFSIRGFGLASEIRVEGNGNVIGDGDNTPRASDFSDFGAEDILTGSQSQIFTIFNSGNADLVLSNPANYVDIVGNHAADFTVSVVPTSPVATNNSTSFTITFDPEVEGLRQATVSIANNDLDENPYTFVIQGIGLASPEISVEANGKSIADGDTTPASSDNTDFGNRDILAATQINSFYIKNLGSGALTLSGTPLLVISGSHAGDFLVSTPPSASSVAAGDSVSFAITFNPTAVGLRAASISIANDDEDENPFNFSIWGTGVASPDLNILGNGISITSGDLTPSVSDSTVFDSTIVDSSFSIGFSLKNTGSAVLNLTGTSPYITLSGDNAGDFSILQIPTPIISAGGGTTGFRILFTPSAEGGRTAVVNIASDDPNDNPFTFTISGFCRPMPLPELQLTETVDLDFAAPGDTLTYTITYLNVGVGLATDVVVDHEVPSETTYVINSAGGIGMTIEYSHDGGTIYNSNQANVTNIKYTRSAALISEGSGTVTFRVTVN